MEKIPTAKKVYHTVTGCVLESHHNPDIEKAMIEFAKLHVIAALKEASEKSKIDIGESYTVDEITLHPTSLIATVVIKANVDSILNSYPLENIQ